MTEFDVIDDAEADDDDVLGEPGRRPFGSTEKQVRLAIALNQGLSQTKAAIAAGYTGDHNSPTFRSMASKACRSRKVLALVELLNGARDLTEPGDAKEIIGLLWQEARNSANSQSKLKALDLLTKLENMTARPYENKSTAELIDSFTALENPAAAVAAAFLAIAAHESGYRLPADRWHDLEIYYPEVVPVLERLGVAGPRT